MDIYDIGYMSVKIDMLAKFAVETGALIIDVRLSPRSSNPAWSKTNLEKLLGGQYLHVKSLGNKNYKGEGVALVDLELGMKIIAEKINEGPVIIMCGCWDRTTCHRTAIVKEFEKRYGIASIPLSSSYIQEKLSEKEPKQMSLF